MNQIVLTPADSLVLVTSGSDELHTTAHFADRDSAGKLTPSNQLAVVNSAGNIEVCAAPSAGVRLVKTVSVHNTTGGSVTAYLALKRGATVYRLYTVTVAAGATFNP